MNNDHLVKRKPSMYRNNVICTNRRTKCELGGIGKQTVGKDPSAGHTAFFLNNREDHRMMTLGTQNMNQMIINMALKWSDVLRCVITTAKWTIRNHKEIIRSYFTRAEALLQDYHETVHAYKYFRSRQALPNSKSMKIRRNSLKAKLLRWLARSPNQHRY